MKLHKITKIILIFAVVAVLAAGQTMAQAYPTEKVSGGYTVGGTNYDLIKGTFMFPSYVQQDGDKTVEDIAARFYYSDGFFDADPNNYNPHLATLSMCMSMAGAYSHVGGKGASVDYSNKWKNINQFMQDIGAENIYRNFYNQIRPQTDSLGVTIAAKTYLGDRKLLIIAPRSSEYEKEWASNVTVGESGEAQGFREAGEILFNEVQKYLENNAEAKTASDNGKLDFWVAGTSRGAVAANLAAKRLVDSYVQNNSGNRVFAYCIETPAGGLDSELKSGSDYKCIHNIVNLNDIVPHLGPNDGKYMFFKRYGIDHYMPGSEANYTSGSSDNQYYSTSHADYSAAKAKMAVQLKAVNPLVIFDDSFKTWGLNVNIDEMVKSKKFFKEGDYIPMNEFLGTLFSKYFTIWTEMSRTKYTNGLQVAVRDFAEIVFDCTPSQVQEVRNRFDKLWRDTANKIDLIMIALSSLGEWHKPDFQYRTEYMNRMVDKLKKFKVFDSLNLSSAKKQKLLEVDMPCIIDFIMRFASNDALNAFYNTGGGLTQILTFFLNSSNMFVNHVSEISLAWLRSYDSLYANETQRVTVSSTPEYKIPSISTASDSKIVTEIAAVDDIFAEHGTAPATALPSTVKAGTSSGEIVDLSIDWDTANAVYYTPSYSLSGGSLWEKVAYADALNKTDQLMVVFNGTVKASSGVTISSDVKTAVTASVHIAGLERLAPPYASLFDGEYSGPQTITLQCEDGGTIIYGVSYFDGTSSGDSDVKEYSGPITIGSKAADKPIAYALYAYVKSDNADVSADSVPLVWYYKIKPVVSEDDSTYVKNSAAEIVTLSNDQAVCWMISDDNITFSSSNASAADNNAAGDEIYAVITPFDAYETAAKSVNVTFVTIAGITRKGVYNIPVQISTDGGATWTDKQTIKFDTAKLAETFDSSTSGSEATSSSGSSSGCSAGFTASVLGLALIALIFKFKTR